ELQSKNMSSFQSDDETEMTIADNPERTTQAGAAASQDHELRSRQNLERALQRSKESEARLQKIVDTITEDRKQTEAALQWSTALLAGEKRVIGMTPQGG